MAAVLQRSGVKYVFKLRIVFEKGEKTRFIGHLDILRTFIRGLKRAKIPVAYSNGFNPHAIMTFALPIGVGVTSQCEIMDVTIKEKLPEDLIINSINNNMQEGGIKIISANYTDKPMPEIEKAEYIVEILNDGEVNTVDFEKAFAMQEIIVDKKSKKKLKQVNITEHIFEYEIIETKDNIIKLRLVVSAGNTFNIKPSLIITGLSSVIEALNPIGIKEHRTKFIFKN